MATRKTAAEQAAETPNNVVDTIKPTEELGRAIGQGDVKSVDPELGGLGERLVAVEGSDRAVPEVELYAAGVPGYEGNDVLNAPFVPVNNPASPHVAPNVPPAELSTMQEFILKHEELAQAQGLYVTQASFPGEGARIYPGRYAGIKLTDGKRGVTYSDGTTH